MTNEEEKILEEEKDITLEDAAEEAEELQEETQDEGRAIEIPVERREDVDLEEILERPVLRGGLRGAADPNMIQKHMDNFLAKIAGETPIDDKPRNSTEFWLNKIAENLPSGGGGDVYAHYIQLTGGSFTTAGYCVLYDNKPESYTTIAELFATHANTFEYIPIVIKSNDQLCAGTFCNIINAQTLSFGTYNLTTNEELSAMFSSIASDTVIKLS